MTTLPDWGDSILRRWVLRDEATRDSAYRSEAGRIRRGDRVSWIFILSGFLPLAMQNPILMPVWIGLIAVVLILRHRGFTIEPGQENIFALLAAFAGIAGAVVSGELVWGFSSFLILIAAILIFKANKTVEVQHTYLVVFVLFVVFAHLTLEYTFLIGLLIITISGLMLMLRYQFPDAVRVGRFREVLRMLLPPLAIAALIAVPIFIVMPRVPMSVLNIKKPPVTAGFSDQIQFGELGSILESNRTFMTVRAERGQRWRGIVLDFYTGKGWKRRPRVEASRTGPVGGLIWLADEFRIMDPTKLLRQEFIMEPTACRFIFAASSPVAIENDYGEIRRDRSLTMTSPAEPQAKKTRYVAYSGKTPVLEPPEFIDKLYLQLPANYPSPRISQLAQQLVANSSTNRQRAETIEYYLRNNFSYTLDTQVPDGKDPVEILLFEARAGHCEFFSTSMVVMLRTLGVPARVVNGFGQGSYDPIAGTYTVLERNAHSWVEALVEGESGDLEWAEYDPTSGNGDEGLISLAERLGLTQFEWFRTAKGYLSLLDFEWQRYVVSFSTSMQAGIVNKIIARLEALEIRARVWWQTNRHHLKFYGAFLLTLLVFLIAFFKKRLILAARWIDRRARPIVSIFFDAFRRAMAEYRAYRARGEDEFYGRMVRSMRELGLQKKDHETPREFLRRIETGLPQLHEPSRRITEIHYQVCYRGIPLASADQIQIDSDLESIALGKRT